MNEETSNGNNEHVIQPSDNVDTVTGDSAGLPVQSGRADKQKLVTAVTTPPSGTKLDSADLGASKPVPVPEQVQRPFQLPTVVACGHKLDTRRLPVHANCFNCWEAFFETNAQHLGNVHQTLMTEGSAGVTRLYGEKFTKMFGKYLRKQLLQKVQAPSSPSVEGATLEVPSITLEGGLQ